MLVSLNTGIPLSEIDTVDHKDRDFTNDDIGNLRIIERRKHLSDDALRVRVDDVNCPVCKKSFTPTKDQRNLKNRAGPFCGKSCAGKYSTSVQHHNANKLERTELNKTYYRIEKEEK
jgi:hypothetical protein